MSQCVPSWDLDDHPNPPTHLPFNYHPSPAPVVPISDYEVTELAWENGRLVLHGFGHSRIEKPIPKERSSAAAASSWEKPRPSGTLEAVVDQATRAKIPPTPSPDLAVGIAGPPVHYSNQTVMDSLVPTAAPPRDDVADPGIGRKRPRVGDGGCVCASQGSAAVRGERRRGESTRVRRDPCAGDDLGFTTTNSTSPSRAEGVDGGSPETENTSFGDDVGGGAVGGRRLLAFDDRDSVSLGRRSQADGDGVCAYEAKVMKGSAGRVSASTGRSRVAAIHNQSERKRRDRINQRMKALQKLVPNSSKTDKASMLDEVIEYLRKLQAQVQMLSTMMMPMAMPQLQMSMMAHMIQMAKIGMGMSMMDVNSLSQLSHAGLPPLVHPSAFLPLPTACWDGSGDKMQQPGGNVLPDPFSTFLAYQTAQPPPPQPPLPPAGMDAFRWMAALHQQLHQQPPPGNPNP